MHHFKNALIAGAAYLIALMPAHAAAQNGAVICGKTHDLALVGGKIHTMMPGAAITDAMLIRGGVIAAVGKIGKPGPCTDVIDLKGRTVIPGLIDNHLHFIRLGNLPGYHLRGLERAFDVATVLDLIRKRVTEIPGGALISLIGGIQPTQFAEHRFPTLQELDAAAPANPVYLSADGFGPGQTNSMGREYLRKAGIPVADDGKVNENADTAKAFAVLSPRMPVEERAQALLDEQKFVLSVGLTTLMDQGGAVPGVGFLDEATGYDAFLSILRAGNLHVRMRLFVPALDEAGDNNQHLARQLANRWPGFGSDLAKLVGIGEWSVGMTAFAKPLPDENSRTAVMTIAKHGWPYHQHVISTSDIEKYLSLFEEAAKAGYPVGSFNWSLDHLNGMTKDQVKRANALGIGLALHGYAYLSNGNVMGPPYRMILDNATGPLGGGSDAARISTLNPWSMIYHMVTGRNNSRTLVNDGQQISRQEAIRLWTGPDQGYFSKESGLLGGIAPGRYGDITVLDRDVFDKKAVSDDDIRTMSSVLTIVGGKIVYDAGVVHKDKSRLKP